MGQTKERDKAHLALVTRLIESTLSEKSIDTVEGDLWQEALVDIVEVGF